ncbi:hypothetical protein [Vibrio splendidus]|uniref:hypothetical protein n=1 Tax=Vibrio splendidus TaxID=29497 RepID=UPI000D393229|nr:hypothetical protein [Vibrio splendidus]PTO66206.1 hypothetical protein CWN96_11700 [Vibrio splendidus]
MKIIQIAVGNDKEAFVENNLSAGVNVIFSDDNNRGKTVITQGLMFSLGNPPMFPNGFDFKEYYFYSKIEIDGDTYDFLRKGTSFFVRVDEKQRLFTTEAEFRYYFHKNIYQLPNIIKKGQDQMVDFGLFYELFFIGQDKRDPSNIINHGRFNKDDFKSMLVKLLDSNVEPEVDPTKDKELKDQISRLKVDLKVALKKLSLVKKSSYVASYTSRTSDLKEASDLAKNLKAKHTDIAKLKNKRSRLINRSSKLEALILELNSLNKKLSEGQVVCGECKSEKIIFKTDDLEFDVSNGDVRRSILSSIRENIREKEFAINEVTFQINELQSEVNKQMTHTPPDFFQLAFFRDEVLEEEKYDIEARDINLEIDSLTHQLKNSSESSNVSENQISHILSNIVRLMSQYHEMIDPDGKLNFDDIFSKRDTIYSGSDSQEYYFCRVMAIQSALNHPFPLIIDSFRDGELSTRKEEEMLQLYNSLGKQVILTSTLKSEEYNTNKYSHTYINALDYSIHKTHKLLGSRDLPAFTEILSKFKVLARSS